ncbi:hypothetical protein SAMN05216359_12112 [Roseateles sp. YR242]|uniref:hypothetical protein n=1 Tax=Roseateles sp. YR242 TaxID=1855305 RepID=UPI0008B26F59|nr:hypothetical protein [Roseateles sp. YR242]SEL87393.1 hypothetical protein SAMN05216359_12112 [Roseateles sp. YR242]
MNTTRLAQLSSFPSLVAAACIALGGTAPAWAADAPAAVPPAAEVPAPTVREVPPAKVEQIVQEDDKVRIEETRVRGLTQKVVVKRKDGAPEYEILLSDTGKDIPVRQGADRGNAGQRVWRLLSF